jgi:hypothetical protein
MKAPLPSAADNHRDVWRLEKAETGLKRLPPDENFGIDNHSAAICFDNLSILKYAAKMLVVAPTNRWGASICNLGQSYPRLAAGVTL